MPPSTILVEARNVHTPARYPCSICFLAQGSKTVYLGSMECHYDPGYFLLSRYNVVAESSSGRRNASLS